MSRFARRLVAAALLLLGLLLTPGCFTVGLWDVVGEVNSSVGATAVHRARLEGEVLELIVDYHDEGPQLLRVDLRAATSGFFDGHPTFTAELVGSQRADLPGSFAAVRDGGLGAELFVRPAPPPRRRPGQRAQEPEPTAEVDAGPPAPAVYWFEPNVPASGASLIVCLRRADVEPVYVAVHDIDASAAAGFAYAGAVLATPVTVALDVATAPAQLIVFLAVLNLFESIFG
ncbi:MAG: hypothetical protein AB7N76_30395 [Planctomycetota bacterium]